jgi:small GTP-binding protein
MKSSLSEKSQDENQALFKIIIFGEGGVGKTTLIKRYLEGYFEDSTKMTVGVDFFMKTVKVKDQQASLQIWDFAGEDRFRFLLPSYVSGASGGIFMYDISRFMTLKHINEWLGIFNEEYSKKNSDGPLPIIILGGKKDLDHKRSVEPQDAKEKLDNLECFKYMECSSKTGENVEEVFKILTEHLLKKADMI